MRKGNSLTGLIEVAVKKNSQNSVGLVTAQIFAVAGLGGRVIWSWFQGFVCQCTAASIGRGTQGHQTVTGPLLLNLRAREWNNCKKVL